MRERSDRGQVLPFMVVVVMVVAAALTLAVRMSRVLDAAAQARTAADAAALAGVVAGESEAVSVAAANGGELIDFARSGQTVAVVVRVGPATQTARAEAIVSIEPPP